MKQKENRRPGYKETAAYFLVIFGAAAIVLLAVLAFFYRGRAGGVGQMISENLLYFLLVFFGSLFAAILLTTRNIVNSKMRYYHEYDSMTKAYNRLAGLDKLAALLPRDERRSTRLSICCIDINGLREVNETLGSEAGDGMIIAAVDAVNSIIREDDFVVRLGGDEFLIVFLHAGGQEAEMIWSRIRAKFDQISAEENRPYVLSVCHGIAEHDSSVIGDLDDLIRRAEQAMLLEKNTQKTEVRVVKEQGALP